MIIAPPASIVEIALDGHHDRLGEPVDLAVLRNLTVRLEEVRPDPRA